jgi:hypothetical protein
MKHTKTMIAQYRVDVMGVEQYSIFEFDMKGAGYSRICEVVVEFETPDDFNPVAAQVAALKEQEKELHRQFNEHIARIKADISKLECLEFTA